MKIKKKKEFFAQLELADFGTFMDHYLATFNDTKALLEKSHSQSKEGGPNARYNVNLHYRLRQATVALEKFGTAFRLRTIELEKRRGEHGYNAK